MATAEPITALLQRHLAGEDISGQIADMVGGDPRLASIMSLLADREAQLKSEIDAHPHDEADQWAELRDRDQESRRKRAEALQAQWQQMSAELERLCTTLDEVACALGACPRCLGADPECVLCRGRSGPGSLPPDASSFNRIVLPALRAHAHCRSRKVRDHESEDTLERSA
jgi:hypothetical protein